MLFSSNKVGEVGECHHSCTVGGFHLRGSKREARKAKAVQGKVGRSENGPYSPVDRKSEAALSVSGW